MNNYWTQELPKVSGYYWFAYECDADGRIKYFNVCDGRVSAWDYYEDEDYELLTEDGYYYSAHPIEDLPWRIK